MSDISSNNKRIAKNTMMLYFRMFISMAVSLYASRVILKTLGAEDYGIYNVVGSIVAMFSFINSTMSSATSRFLTFELGKGDEDKLKVTFNAAFWVHVIIAIIILIICETIGLWFLENKMVIPEERKIAAHIVFQLSILTTIISITQVPYNATLIAHEKMNVYAYVEIVNVFLRLGSLYILVVAKMDKLILYAIITLLISTAVALFYRIYSIRHYRECRVTRNIRIEIIKPMLSFSVWDFYGNMSVTARTQGVSMLLNVFFGPIMNAAAGIAASVQNTVMSFANNVNIAVRPQIIKYYSQGEYKQMEQLINNACKINFLILSMLIIPLCSEIDYILSIWLGDVPEMTSTFCVLTLSFNLFANISYLVNTGNHAAGKIFRPSVINGSLYILVLPTTYLSFRFGCVAWIPYLFNLLAVILGMLSNAYTLHLNVPEYSFLEFIKKVLVKCIATLIFGIIGAFLVKKMLPPSLYRLLLTCFFTTTLMGIFGWYVMIPRSLRLNIIDKVRMKICRKD